MLAQIIQRWRIVLTSLAIVGLIVWAIVNANSTPSDHHWLMKQPCAAPCWEGITPGLTTAKEALQLLQENQLFSDIEIFYPPRPSGIIWNWRGTNIGGEARFDNSATQIIERISISLLHPAKLKDVNSLFGYPNYVNVIVDTGSDINNNMQIAYGMELYYIQSGFYINMSRSGRTGFIKPAISQETTFSYVTFFTPSMDGLSLARKQDKTLLQTELIPWQGTFDFDVYCKLKYQQEIQICQ